MSPHKQPRRQSNNKTPGNSFENKTFSSNESLIQTIDLDLVKSMLTKSHWKQQYPGDTTNLTVALHCVDEADERLRSADTQCNDIDVLRKKRKHSTTRSALGSLLERTRAAEYSASEKSVRTRTMISNQVQSIAITASGELNKVKL